MARFVDEVQIQPQALSTGAASGLLSLSDKLEAFSNSTDAFISTIAARRGQAEAATIEQQTTIVDGQEVTVQPETRKAGVAELILFGGAQTRSYNQTIRNGYLASLSNDNREAVTNIEAANPDNVTGFNEAMNGYITGVLQTADPSVRQAVAAQLDNLSTDARIRVQAASNTKFEAEANAEINSALMGAQDAGIRAVRAGDQIAAAEANLEYAGIVLAQVESGTLTEAAGTAMINDNLRTVAGANIIAAVVNEAQTPGGMERAAQALLDFNENPLAGFTVDQQDALKGTLISELNGVLSLKNKIESGEQESITANQEFTSADMYIGVLDGTVTPADITLALASKQIDESQATKLINIYNSRGAGVDDHILINQVNEAIRNGEDPQTIRTTIQENTGGRLTSATGGSLTALLNDSLDSESPLNTSNARRAESFITQSMRVTGPFGGLDTGAERRLANAKRDFSNAVLAGEDPWVVADNLVDRDAFTRAPNPMFGTKEDIPAAMTALDEAFLAGTVSDEDFQFQFTQLQGLMDLKTTLDDFEAARTEALRGR